MDFPVNEEIGQMDDLLKMDIVELKSQIEENQLLYGINNKELNSIYIPKDPEFYQKKRRMKLNRTLNFQIEKSNRIASDSIQMEIDSCEKFEYREKSLPLLVNQYFKNRIKMLMILKCSQMIRFKRYCINKVLIEYIKNDYNARLNAINEEYIDVKTRYNRLQASKEGYICNTDQGIDELTMDDILIYMKWYVGHLYSLEYIATIVKIIRWIPVKFRKKNVLRKENDTDSNSKSEKSSRHNRSGADAAFMHYQEQVLTARSSEKISEKFPYLLNAGIASGGGLAVDEKNLLFPLHTNDIQYIEHLLGYFCMIYSIDMDIKKIRNSADEMELYSIVNRRFKIVFNIQEQMRTFKVYDRAENSLERWGMESSVRAILKRANWMPYNTFKPKTNLLERQNINLLRNDGIRDEFLISAALLVKKSNVEETQNNLRHNALIIQHLPVVYNTAVVSNQKGFDIADIMKTIYTKSDFNARTFTTDENSDNKSGDDDNYNFTEALQSLGLDESTETKDDSSTVQGAYLSYLHLRFLKVRDLQRTCLSILNYFRSIERTLVIDANMFSKTASKSQKKRSSTELPTQDCPNIDPLGSHDYLHATVQDFQVSEEEIMKMTELENRDDFYLHDDGRIHVQDLMGNWIMYDIALKDFEKLEDDLILIGSHYINNDKEMRLATLFNRKQSQTEHNEGSDFYISEYGHREVDRFGVLYDLWCQHTEFMENKKRLVDVYMEAYNSIFKEEDKNNIAQILINTMHRKPRVDIKSKYFIVPYRFENLILTREFEIIRMILNKEILRQRNFLLKCYKNTDYPYRFMDKLSIAVNSDESVLQNLYFMEFIPSLAYVYHIRNVIDYAYLSVLPSTTKLSVTGILKTELELLDTIINEINEFEDFGGKSFEADILNVLNSNSMVCNPLAMQEVAKKYLKIIDSKNTRGEKKARKCKTINGISRLLELSSVRFRLIHLLYESEFLHSIYDSQASLLGYDQYHLFMRLVPFDKARKVEGAENHKPLLYVSSVQDDDSMIDKFRPNYSYPAIHELDKDCIGKLEIDTEDQIIQFLDSKGLENMQLMLKMQVTHKNAVAVGIMLCDNCRPSVYGFRKDSGRRSADSGNMSTASSAFNLPISAQIGPTPLALDSSRAGLHALNDSYPEAFFSLQLEKTPIRDKILNAFLKKYPYPSNVPETDMEKAKRDGISMFITSFCDRISQIALKSQIIAYYNSLIEILNLIPEVVSDFFQFGKAFNPSRGNMDANCDVANDPRILKHRCRKVISDDGSKLINIWYIPHFSEILFLHRQLEDSKSIPILRNFLRLLMAFHDIIHYLVGFWKFSFNCTRVSEKLKKKISRINEIKPDQNCHYVVHPIHKDQNSETIYFSDYDDSNTYQIKKELVDLEIQIANLQNPNDIEEVITLLNTRKDFHYLYFEICVSLLLKEVLLATNNDQSHKKLMYGIETTIPMIRNLSLERYMSQGLNLPSVVSNTDPEVENLFPWRTMIWSTIPRIVNFDCMVSMSSAMQLCLIDIPERLKQLVQNKFYNLNLTLEDILVENSKPGLANLVDHNIDMLLISKKMPRKERKEIHANTSGEHGLPGKVSESEYLEPIKHLSVRHTPIEAYKLFLSYLVDLKRLFLLKYEFGCRKASVKEINNGEIFTAITKLYKTSILFPVLRKLSYDMSLSRVYFYGPIKENDLVTYPEGIPETFVIKLLINALITEKEKFLINTMRCKIIRKIDQVIKQRHYETVAVDPENSVYLVLKNSLKLPNLVTDLVHKLEAPFHKTENFVGIMTEQKEEICDLNDSEDSTVKEEKVKRNDDQEKAEQSLEQKELPLEQKELPLEQEQRIIYKKKYINYCLQYLGVTLLRVHREIYENFAMYFENQLKHQQQLLNERNRQCSVLKEYIYEKEQSLSVEKQFILAKKVSNHILEINVLRGKLKEEKLNNSSKEAELRNLCALKFKFIFRNLYSLSFEQMTCMKISISRFHSDVFQRVNVVRLEAWEDMNKIKEKSGAKYTTDDELASRNITLSNLIKHSLVDNINLTQLIARMKSLINWIYNYTVNDQDNMMNETISKSYSVKNVVFVTIVDADQKVKLMKCELKRLKVIISSTQKELSDLKCTLNKEIGQQIPKHQGGIDLKKSTRQKEKQISELLRQLQEMNGKVATMTMKFQEHMLTNKTVAFKSHKEVERLSKILDNERSDKLQAFTKVDDLLSQVYEFEAGFAMVKGLSTPKKPTLVSKLYETKISKNELGGNYPPPLRPQARLKYKTIINRYCIPFTPCHFLPHRRDRTEAQRLKMRIKNKLTKEVQSDSKAIFLPKIRKATTFVRNPKQ